MKRSSWWSCRHLTLHITPMPRCVQTSPSGGGPSSPFMLRDRIFSHNLSTSNKQAALSAGKHVIVEKPIVNTSSQVTELIHLAKSKSLILAPYQNRRWDSDFLTLRRLLEKEKVFGEIAEFETRFDRWNPFLSLKGGKAWKEKDEWGNGVLFDLGSHLVS